MTIRSKADIKEMVAAIEADAGQDFPGLSESIADALAGNPGKVTTPEQILLKAARKKMGYTQPALASWLETSVGTVRDWEQGRYPVPGAVKKLLRIVIKHPDLIEETA